MTEWENRVQEVAADGERALFERVWARVGVSAEACPIELVPAAPEGEVVSPPPETIQSVPAPEAVNQQNLLRRCVRDCVEGRQFYRALAQRGDRQSATVLLRLAREEWAQAKAFSAASFLLYGSRCLPELPLPRLDGGFWEEVRRRFWAEQRRAAEYPALGEQLGAAALHALCTQTAVMAQTHAAALRELVEHW